MTTVSSFSFMLLISLPSISLFRHSLNLSMNTGGRDDFDWSRCCTGSNLGLDPSSFLLKVGCQSQHEAVKLSSPVSLILCKKIPWSHDHALSYSIRLYPILSYPMLYYPILSLYNYFLYPRPLPSQAGSSCNFLYHYEGIFTSILPFLSSNRIRKESRFMLLMCQLSYMVPFHLHVIFILCLV